MSETAPKYTAQDREHRGKIMREAKESLIEAGLGIDAAVVVVKAIVAGKIKHTKMEF